MTRSETTQVIRLLDVLFVGPLMIAAALDKKEGEKVDPLKRALALVGTATIIYNGVNYLAHLKKK